MAEDQTINYMDMDEFRIGGFLQEANRLFFHPLGLAISVIVDDETGKATGLGPVWDYREDLEGVFYGPAVIDQKKIKNIESLWLSKAQTRMDYETVKTDDDGIQEE